MVSVLSASGMVCGSFRLKQFDKRQVPSILYYRKIILNEKTGNIQNVQ